MDKRRRRDIIRGLIESGHISSQRELVEALAERGLEVDQSTVSRDLREMGAVRLPSSSGRTVYAFAEQAGGRADPGELRRGVREFVIAAECSGNLVVLRTPPGNAQALAAVLDRSRLEEVAGTVAGDDTVLVVVREGHSPSALTARFIEMFE